MSLIRKNKNNKYWKDQSMEPKKIKKAVIKSASSYTSKKKPLELP